MVSEVRKSAVEVRLELFEVRLELFEVRLANNGADYSVNEIIKACEKISKRMLEVFVYI